jgi:hypothetical protein
MSTDNQDVEEAPVERPVADGATGNDDATGNDAAGSADPADTPEERQPSWWHRDHPTFAALSGFFTGLLFVALIPAIYVGILSLMFDNDRVEELFPFVLVTLVVPLGLVANQKTRRFGTYFWIGMLLTAVVVIGVGGLVLWYLVEH